MTIYGHDRQVEMLTAAITRGRLHHAWLLAGPRGIGKSLFAEFAARLLLDADQCESPGARLLAAGSHPDFRSLARIPNDKTGQLARNITVDQVRTLRTLFSTSMAISEHRVVVIDSIDDLERPAANALLKNLEEPPSNTIFLLVSHCPGQLLPTIRSRCRVLAFSALDTAAMEAVLRDRLSDLDDDQRTAAINSAHGSPARAIAFAELDMSIVEDALAELAVSGDRTNSVRSRLAQTLSLKINSARYEAFLTRAPRFIAAHATTRAGTALDDALTAWTKARALSEIAVSNSLIAETVVFEMAGYVAMLAPARVPAKA